KRFVQLFELYSTCVRGFERRPPTALWVRAHQTGVGDLGKKEGSDVIHHLDRLPADRNAFNILSYYAAAGLHVAKVRRRGCMHDPIEHRHLCVPRWRRHPPQLNRPDIAAEERSKCDSEDAHEKLPGSSIPIIQKIKRKTRLAVRGWVRCKAG